MPRGTKTPEAAPDAPPTSRDLNRLADALESASQNLGVIREAIDEAREIIEWGLRNNRFAAPVRREAFTPVNASGDEATVSATAGNLPSRALQPTPAPVPAAAVRGEPTILDRPGKATPNGDAWIPGSKQTHPGKRKQQLHDRLYYRQCLRDIVTLIGYEGRPLPELQSAYEALVEKHGRQAVVDGGDEILRLDVSCDLPMVRLTDEVSKLAWAIIGRPEETAPPTHAKKRS